MPEKHEAHHVAWWVTVTHWQDKIVGNSKKLQWNNTFVDLVEMHLLIRQIGSIHSHGLKPQFVFHH